MHSGKLAAVRLVVTGAIFLAWARACPADSLDAQERASQKASPASYPIRFYQRYISDLRYGHCGFEPSCSQYALEAINDFGILKGSALAADRLVRCDGGRDAGYAMGASGRRLDSPKGSELPCRTPRVPDWLLPPAGDSIPPVDRAIGAAAPVDSLDALMRILRWDASFAHALAAQGDCGRAETEYERLAFYSNTKAMRRWSAMMAGWCYFRADESREAASRFSNAERESKTTAEQSEAAFMVASAYFNVGDYARSERSLMRSDTAAAGAIRAEFLKALCAMADGAWRESADRFARIAKESPAPLDRSRALLLAENSRRGLELPKKSPSAALVMSTIVPGAGQCYAGRSFDGFRHFVFDGLLIFSVVQLMRDKQHAAGYLLGTFTLPFYVGNIMGAKKSVERGNACTRLKYVTESVTASSTQ